MLAKSLISLGAKYGELDENQIKKLFNHPSRYSRRILPDMASSVRSDLAELLKVQFDSMPHCLAPLVVVADHWSDKYRQIDFTSIGVSFVDNNFKLQSYDLCVKEYDGPSKHAVNIRADLLAKLETYVPRETLQKVEGKFVIVSDSDAKLVAAVKDDFDRLSCTVHDLSLAAKAGMKSVENTAIGTMIEDCKTLVRYFKKTGMNRQLSTTLKQDISTRFNSVYIMLDSIERMLDEVTAKLTATDNIQYISNIRRRTLSNVVKELKRFSDATKKLSVEKEVTIHLVLPVLHELQSKLCKQADKYRKDDERDIEKLCNELSKAVKEKCLNKLTWYEIAATVLYLPFRDHPAVTSREEEVDRVQQDFRAMLVTIDSGHSQTQPVAKKAKTVLPDSGSDSDEEYDADSSQTFHDDEVTSYSTTAYECDNATPLEFWKTQQKKLPGLAKIARSIFAIPASQNKTERSFSAAGNIMTDRRTMLDPDHLDELLILRSNYRQQHAANCPLASSDEDEDE
jgi:hypothetical protein